MRISTAMLYTQSLQDVQNRYEKIYKANEKVSSGKRVNRPSDDPLDSGDILGYRSMLASIEQYRKNINTGLTWLRYTESSLSDAEQVFMDAKTLAEQLATGTYSEENRTMLAEEVEQLYEHLLQIGNTKVMDRYLFAGFKTTTKPFTADDDYNILYNGDDNDITINVQQDIRVNINTTGYEAFIESTNVFDVLRDFRNALSENDQDAVGAMLPRIDDAINKIVEQRAYVGTALHEMEASQMVLEDYGLATSELLSTIEDTDVVEAVTDLESNQIALEATLMTTTMITDLSILQFLK